LHIIRKYANQFEWNRNEKNIKEVGIVRELIESISKHCSCEYRNLRPRKDDPPDCLAETFDGSLLGFEVTELVDQKAIELNEKGREVYRDWTDSEVLQELQTIIEEKDSKEFLGGRYEKLILVIHTAEPVLTHQQLRPVIDSRLFRQTKQLHEAYLLFRYDPETQGYPYIQLNITANTLESWQGRRVV
jgi:hypothetical protein